MDLLYNLLTLRVSRSPQDKRLMTGDEVGWFYTCIILFWKPNKEAWLDRIYVVRKITFAGQNWGRMNVWTLGASPVTGQEKKRRIIRPHPLRFSLYPVPVSQCHLIGRNTFMLIDENYIEFSISIWRNVPVVNTKLCRFTVVLTSLHQ